MVTFFELESLVLQTFWFLLALNAKSLALSQHLKFQLVDRRVLLSNSMRGVVTNARGDDAFLVLVLELRSPNKHMFPGK